MIVTRIRNLVGVEFGYEIVSGVVKLHVVIAYIFLLHVIAYIFYVRLRLHLPRT